MKSTALLALFSLAHAIPHESDWNLRSSSPHDSIEARTIVTSVQLVGTIGAVTKLSSNLADVTAKIDTGSVLGVGILLNPSAFAPVLSGFENIIATVSGAITMLSPAGSVSPLPAGDDQNAVCTALHDFVLVHQNLLRILIGKSGLLQSIGLAPVAGVLRTLEAGVDTVAGLIIALVPGCAAQAQTDISNLDGTIQQAICAYTPLGTLPIVQGLVCSFTGGSIPVSFPPDTPMPSDGMSSAMVPMPSDGMSSAMVPMPSDGMSSAMVPMPTGSVNPVPNTIGSCSCVVNSITYVGNITDGALSLAPAGGS